MKAVKMRILLYPYKLKLLIIVQKFPKDVLQKGKQTNSRMSWCSGRTRPRIMPSSLSLPQNTITDILSRLPVKSLTRFKSVSKHWANLTSSPAFITAHLRRSSPHPYLLIRRYNSQSGWEYGIWLVSNPTLNFTTKLLRVPLEESLPRFPKIVGVVDGLVCLDISLSFTSDFVMWNPGTKLHKHLPLPLITYTKDNPIWMVFHGFGFDSFNNDYKLVRIVSFRGPDSPCTPRVEVYSWRECVWKEIEERFESALLCGGQEAVVVDGCLNWAAIGLQRYADRKVVISFDMAREVFKTIALPPVTRDGDIKVMSYMGLLAVAVYPLVCPGDDNDMDRFEFWVQRDCEDGVKRWSSMVSFDNFSKNFVPVGTWRDREVVFKHMGMGVRDRENQSSLFLFDPVDRSTKRLPIDCVDFCFEGYSYVESLMSVN